MRSADRTVLAESELTTTGPSIVVIITGEWC